MVIFNSGVLFLEDIGGIGAPGGGLDRGLRVNSTQAVYYGGEGFIDIQLDGAGNAQLSGMQPSLTVALAVPFPTALVIQSDNKSCGFVVEPQPGIASFQFDTGQNAVDITIMVHSPLQGVTVDGVGFRVSRSDGWSANAATPSDSGLVVNTLNGALVFLEKKMGGAFTWTVNVDNPNNIPCNIVVAIKSDSLREDGAFFASLPAAVTNPLISLGLFPPLPSGMQPLWFWDNWPCTFCQAQVYFVIGAIAYTAPQIFAEVTYRRLAGWVATAETINTVAGILKNLLQIDDGLANTIANSILLITDPLEWPKAICQAEGICP